MLEYTTYDQMKSYILIVAPKSSQAFARLFPQSKYTLSNLNIQI